MEPFSYDSSMGTITIVPWHPFSTWFVYKIYVNEVFLVELQKEDDIWYVPHPLIKELYTSDIQAIGDEIDKHYDSQTKYLDNRSIIMCNNYSVSKNERKMVAQYGITSAVSYEAKEKVAPTDAGLVITADRPCDMQKMHFGLVPHWAKDERSKSMNARAETLMEKPTFRPLMLHHKRCLVLSDGYFEHKTEGKRKIPFRISVKDREIFAFAGLWSRWLGFNNEPYDSYCIITTEPNSKLAEIHNRMPVILSPEEEKLWLSKDVPLADLLKLLDTYPEEELNIVELPEKAKESKEMKSTEWTLPF